MLAYVPDYQTMQLAIRYARGGALAVIEGFTTPLCGWAIEVGALDLLENLVTPDLRSAHLRSALDRIHFYGNNGWTNGFGKDATVRLLHDIVEQNELDQDLILGFMLAHGHHHKSIEHLARIIEKAREFNPNRQRANSRRW
ncbi:hypothetical protein BCD48_44535 [Pseudofrankia sp. BMG5.36]|nr:hypothetical protein BCD48_44535 [Pseudofrankia sp. BMG5.36]